MYSFQHSSSVCVRGEKSGVVLGSEIVIRVFSIQYDVCEFQRLGELFFELRSNSRATVLPCCYRVDVNVDTCAIDTPRAFFPLLSLFAPLCQIGRDCESLATCCDKLYRTGRHGQSSNEGERRALLLQ